MNRFGDIDVSFKRLPPVYGYRSEKIVPIENALEPIQHQIDELPYYIKIAKKHCHFPSEHGLSKDESAAVYIYTMEWGDTTLYRVLNKALRSENRQALKIWFPYLKLFDTALDKLPTVKEILWRGVSLDIGTNFTKNQLLTWWSVSSCSSSVDVIKDFLGNKQSSTLFLIEAVNGKKVSGYTEYENEDEIILRMGTQFRVKSNALNHPNGSHVVHLIEVDDNDDEPLDLAGKSSNKGVPDVETKYNAEASAASVLPKSGNTKGTASYATQELAAKKLFHSSTKINFNTKWKQQGITVAGGNGSGNQLNQFSHPSGISIDDDDQTIYIADSENHRIVEWKCYATKGQIVAGGNGEGNRTNQLKHPTHVIIDKENNSLIISDWGNNRIMRWSRQNNTKNGEIIIKEINCSDITMDKNGSLYVADNSKNEVRRWKRGDQNGTIVAGGNGKGNKLNQFNNSSHVFVDEDYSLYVSDYFNNRVMKWLKGAKEGIVVAGGNGEGNSLTQFAHPDQVIVDQLGQIYVADYWNHRVMRWCKGAKEGTIVVGGNEHENQSNLFSYPSGLSFDRQGNLYVLDRGNQRIQKFEID